MISTQQSVYKYLKNKKKKTKRIRTRRKIKCGKIKSCIVLRGGFSANCVTGSGMLQKTMVINLLSYVCFYGIIIRYTSGVLLVLTFLDFDKWVPFRDSVLESAYIRKSQI